MAFCLLTACMAIERMNEFQLNNNKERYTWSDGYWLSMTWLNLLLYSVNTCSRYQLYRKKWWVFVHTRPSARGSIVVPLFNQFQSFYSSQFFVFLELTSTDIPCTRHCFTLRLIDRQEMISTMVKKIQNNCRKINRSVQWLKIKS